MDFSGDFGESKLLGVKNNDFLYFEFQYPPLFSDCSTSPGDENTNLDTKSQHYCTKAMEKQVVFDEETLRNGEFYEIEMTTKVCKNAGSWQTVFSTFIWGDLGHVTRQNIKYRMNNLTKSRNHEKTSENHPIWRKQARLKVYR